MYNGFKNAYKYVMKYYYKHTRYGNLIYCKKKNKQTKKRNFPLTLAIYCISQSSRYRIGAI